ncbi:MAG TPA: TPM domain-containing protein [Synechococcales cyanobacterium M55_K2018_004]|nr:TPM domain-containing protein [Synechococcales cyanobacterium M55_K2018_004]
MVENSIGVLNNMPGSCPLSLQRWRLAPLLGFILAVQCWLFGVPAAIATSLYDLPEQLAADAPAVLDEAEALSRLSQNSLNSRFEKLKAQTGKAVHLVTIRRLDYGETIESFTQKLFEQWFPTPEAQANQVLLVLDTLTNNAAIRVGQAAQQVLSDAVATSTLQDTLMAPLRQGDRYNQAFLDAGERLLAVLSGEPDPGPPIVAETINTEGTFATPEETAKSNATVWVIALLIGATVIPMATYYFYQFMQSQ